MNATLALDKIVKLLGLRFKKESFFTTILEDGKTEVTNNADGEFQVGQTLYVLGEATLQQKKQQGKELTEQEKQYLRAAEQIFVDQFGNMGNFNSAKDRQDRESYRNMTKDMYVSETGNKDFDVYRKSPTEAQAFGVGNMSFPSNLRRTGVNPHFDPSMTTEFDILLSMFEKLPESLKKSAAMEKQEKIEKNRQGSSDVYLNFSKDMFQNPFESTVK